MVIKIMGRIAIEKYCSMPLNENVALISVCDAGDDFVSLLFKPANLLQLSFDDVDSDVFVDELGESYPVNQTAEIEEKYNMLSREQASQIACFVNHVWGKVDVLVCQCEHGQSRSAAIAAAITEYKLKRGIEVFADERYYPNKFIYWRVLNKLKEMDE